MDENIYEDVIDINELRKKLDGNDKKYIDGVDKFLNVDNIEKLMYIYGKRHVLLKNIKMEYRPDIFDKLFNKIKHNKFGMFNIYIEYRHLFSLSADISIKFYDQNKFREKWLPIINNCVIDAIKTDKRRAIIQLKTSNYYVALCMQRNFRLLIDNKWNISIYSNRSDKNKVINYIAVIHISYDEPKLSKS